jgi:8-oxo-dGTP pyrophosphatase MutT (NUDIX family)
MHALEQDLHREAPGRALGEVVAAVLSCEGRICLLRRSPEVASDAGLWHCVTGYLPAGVDPRGHAMIEVAEETGLRPSLLQLRGGSVLDLAGGDGRRWKVHAFHFQANTRALQLNWEHDAAIWLRPAELAALPAVSWFGDVLRSLGIDGG